MQTQAEVDLLVCKVIEVNVGDRPIPPSFHGVHDDKDDINTKTWSEEERKKHNKKQICRHWWRKGICAFGSSCVFDHPPPQTLPPYPIKNKSTSWNKPQVHKSGRTRIFRNFLLETFGAEYLQQGCGILDVAGGKGVLSFELYNIHDIPSTVCDPRSLDLERCNKIWRDGFYHKQTHFTTERDIPSRTPDNAPRRPRHLRSMFSEDLCPGNTSETLHRARGLFLKSRDRVVSNVDTKTNIDTSTEIESWQDAEELLRNPSLIVGMHPDGAAGSIVEFALRTDVPFALVPCCVFWKTFRGRRLKDGTEVRKYDHLLDWIQETDPARILRKVLPGLEGRNVCLYRL